VHNRHSRSWPPLADLICDPTHLTLGHSFVRFVLQMRNALTTVIVAHDPRERYDCTRATMAHRFFGALPIYDIGSEFNQTSQLRATAYRRNERYLVSLVHLILPLREFLIPGGPNKLHVRLKARVKTDQGPVHLGNSPPNNIDVLTVRACLFTQSSEKAYSYHTCRVYRLSANRSNATVHAVATNSACFLALTVTLRDTAEFHAGCHRTGASRFRFAASRP
jgi:hypothetical protein